jgi:hypothetical protein
MTLEIGGWMPEIVEVLLPQSGAIFQRAFHFHRHAGTKYESPIGFL